MNNQPAQRLRGTPLVLTINGGTSSLKFAFEPGEPPRQGRTGPIERSGQPMARGDKLPDREGGYLFTAQVPATRPASDFTPRLIPAFSGVAVPLEIPLILWHH